MTGKNELKNTLNPINRVFNSFLNLPLIGLSGIIILALLLRFNYLVPEIPLNLDALEYFFYAMDASLLGHLPTNYSPENNGWPAFLSIFFSVFKFDDGLSYIQLQRILSIIISTSITVPVYLLCRKFAGKPESLVAAAIFAFEPRIIQNSLLGITEPLYILLCSMSLLFFLSSDKKLVYFSFALVGISTLVRSESIVLFIVLSIMFFIKFRHDKFVIPKYLSALSITILSILPMILYRINVLGNDGIIGRVTDGVERTQTGVTRGMLEGLENYFMFLGWDLIPLFILFVPVGFFLIFRDLNYKKLTIIISTIAMSIPAVYAYSIPALDSRFLFVLYPMFCIFSVLTIKKFVQRFSNKNLILISILGILFLSSTLFLEYKIMDIEHDKEAYFVAEYLAKSPNKVNAYSPESLYIESADIFYNWDKVKPNFSMEREEGISVRSISHETALISTQGFDNIEDFIQKNKDNGLTGLVIDDNKIRPEFLLDIFKNEEKYPYLIKELDTSDLGYSYHVKIFKIDYEKFLVG